jgi:hypothetical protein
MFQMDVLANGHFRGSLCAQVSVGMERRIESARSFFIKL